MIEEYRQELNKSKIRRINTLYSPDGCRRIKGKWSKKHNVCILGEIEPQRFEAYGWTAPVHGAFVWWHIGQFAGEHETFGGEIGVGNVDRCELYPDMPCTDPYDIFYENMEYDLNKPLRGFYQGLKDRALKIASDIIRGRAHEHDLIYFDEAGSVHFTPKSKKDKVGPRPCPACMPAPPSIHKPKPFRLKKEI